MCQRGANAAVAGGLSPIKCDATLRIRLFGYARMCPRANTQHATVPVYSFLFKRIRVAVALHENMTSETNRGARAFRQLGLPSNFERYLFEGEEKRR
jgi:hypothetical protein